MLTRHHDLPALTPGSAHSIVVQSFGAEGARPEAYIQASLHADEIPGMICAVHLRERLLELETAGQIHGRVNLVPVANPLGLGQVVFGHAMGRFALGDGVNFNRDYPHLTPGVAGRVEGKLGSDAAANVRLIRQAIADEVAALAPATQVGALKKLLVSLAAGADLVLDLHCDSEGALHLYTQPTSAELFAVLGAFLDSRATLTAVESGGDPFDEVFSRPWVELRAQFPDHPIPLASHSVTVELRGQADVGHTTGRADAEAIVAFLCHQGVIGGTPRPVPDSAASITPLASAEPVTAPVAGIVAFHVDAGAVVTAGDPIADIIDPISGVITVVKAQSDGVLFARGANRFTTAGKRLGKIAGTTLNRSGKLLSL